MSKIFIINILLITCVLFLYNVIVLLLFSKTIIENKKIISNLKKI